MIGVNDYRKKLICNSTVECLIFPGQAGEQNL